MKIGRRHFLKNLFIGGSGVSLAGWTQSRPIQAAESGALYGIQEASVLRPELLQDPIRVKSIELLRQNRTYLVRVRSTEGMESITAPNSSKFRDVYPIFLNRIAPFFIGKDACRIETLLKELYRSGSNYKFQGLAFWVGQAAVEMALLDLIGRTRGKPIGELFGPVLQRDIAVYRASGNRGNQPEEEIKYLKRLAAETGAKALKFRLGGRMSNNSDSLPGRTEKLIPLVRETFGPAMTLYADSNSSYDVPNSIRIGRLMEEHQYAFFEEPVPFDHLWETKRVTEALQIPIAGGEQEFSMRRFRWAIENRVVDIVQPDLHYFGGYIRSVKVARMAEAVGMQCTPHMSGSGLGYVNTLHLASFVPNIGPHQEFKGTTAIPCHSDTSSLKCVNGIVRCPSGPGMGVDIDPDYISKFKAAHTL
ncbi:MAG TPA: mandelate racemase/muconate lactonizing enzyme family protein [Verrucomicrobiales bacterium]|nr:mandelate racemase/muconate lactonizing enzyme family protein [Verrucomicrobiales bacterium]HIL71669.1 mandelate racemase/muconate lactonizing enzyme family protein [Verrucomicrobiota bacterium]